MRTKKYIIWFMKIIIIETGLVFGTAFAFAGYTTLGYTIGCIGAFILGYNLPT